VSSTDPEAHQPEIKKVQHQQAARIDKPLSSQHDTPQTVLRVSNRPELRGKSVRLRARPALCPQL
jgi:hypothetical protein